MDKVNNVAVLPSAEDFISQMERLVKIQALAGNDVPSIYSCETDAGIFRAESTISGFGQFSLMKSIYGSGYSVIDCIVFGDVVPSEWASAEARYLTVSRLSNETPWTLYAESSDISLSDIERLTAFVGESPKEVFERLFDLWFYDYPGIVPDDFTLEKIEAIYNQNPCVES